MPARSIADVVPWLEGWLDRAKHPLFVGDTAEFTEWGRFVLQSPFTAAGDQKQAVRLRVPAEAGHGHLHASRGPPQRRPEHGLKARHARG